MSLSESDRTEELRAKIVDQLGLEAFPLHGYRNRDYLEAVFAAGFDVSDLVAAHEVSDKTIYRYTNRYDVERPRPPANGLARRLWEMDPDAIGGEA